MRVIGGTFLLTALWSLMLWGGEARPVAAHFPEPEADLMQVAPRPILVSLLERNRQLLIEAHPRTLAELRTLTLKSGERADEALRPDGGEVALLIHPSPMWDAPGELAFLDREEWGLRRTGIRLVGRARMRYSRDGSPVRLDAAQLRVFQRR